MPSQRTQVSWDFATFGMDQRIPPVSPKVLGFAEAYNGYFTTNASFRSRPGHVYLGSTIGGGAPVDGLFDFWVNSTTQHTIAIAGGVFYQLVAGVWTSVTLGTVAVTAGLPVNFAVLVNSGGAPAVVFGNGTDRNGIFDGTTITDLNAQLAPCKYFVRHGTRIYASGNATNPSRVFWCADGNASDWTTAGDAGFKDSERGDDIVVGLGSYSEDVFVFKGDKNPGVNILSGTSYNDFRYRPLLRGVTGYHRTILNIGNDLLFQGQGGIYSLNQMLSTSGNIVKSRISDPTQKSFSELSFTKIATGCAVWHEPSSMAVFYVSRGGIRLDTAYCVAVPAELSNRYRWAWWEVLPMSAVAFYTDPAVGKTALVGLTTGRVAQWSFSASTDADASSFHSHIRTPFLSHGNQRTAKVAKHLTLTYQAASGLSADLTLLNGSVLTKTVPTSGGAVWGTGLWGTGTWGGGSVSTTNIPLKGISNAHAVQLTKTSGVFEVYDMQFDVLGAGRSER